MDPGYAEKNRQQIEYNAALLNIPIRIFKTKVFDAVFHVEQNPCYLCAKMRRGFLYRYAQEAGCNKIALGHHFNDIIETNLMSMIYAGEVRTMMPKVKSANWESMELIRPMYYVREADIKSWRDENHLQFLQCACRFTERIATADPDTPSPSKRQEIKQLITSLAKENPQVPNNIFHAMENVNLSVVLNYKRKGILHNVLDEYDDTGSNEDVSEFL
jgi:tRNA(Ile)-lysidine synthase TilS/MesJ